MTSHLLLQSFPYRLNEETGTIDYDLLEANAQLYRPKILVAGASAYARHYDYARMRKVADNHNAYLLADMAHISGLVAAGPYPSSFSLSYPSESHHFGSAADTRTGWYACIH